ncbi:transmembrane protein 256-like protein [Pyrus ussuriensis x Pyrus communis]|uniref:Transmembrane protein 256-like protein n=1 Tax=Pyrus ussuriensis x Pyrus communis TaxID=2448454 RepID=A0A5N5GEA0_9ROSA|nr:transmembrane protein 256-like protein [Pyrus ussuriensis x Pyrus communis]
MYKSHHPLSAWNFETYLLSERGTETEAREATTMDLQLWHSAAALSGIAAIGLGAYGAFGFKPEDPTYKEVWLTASLYHLVHTAALLAAPIAKHPTLFGGLLAAGILAFSGTYYAVAFLEDRKYLKLALFGGFVFIAAWGSLLF